MLKLPRPSALENIDSDSNDDEGEVYYKVFPWRGKLFASIACVSFDAKVMCAKTKFPFDTGNSRLR
jgi:hypothetical protein